MVSNKLNEKYTINKAKALILLLVAGAMIYSSCARAKNIIVLEIDTGIQRGASQEIDSHLPVNPANILDYFDSNSHGTHVAGIIVKNTCSEVQLLSCSWFDVLNKKGDEKQYLECLKLAVKEKPDVINISSGGIDFDIQEFNVLSVLNKLGTKIVTAAGNNGQDLSKLENGYYPAKYNLLNIIPVGNLTETGQRNPTSNYNLPNESYEIGTQVLSTLPSGKLGYMSGTSQAAAKKTNSLLLEMCNEKRN